MPTLSHAALDWFRGVVAREGVVRALGSAAREGWELALDYLPSRRRLRFGDIDYDWDHGVETTWANPSLSVRLQEIFTRGRYQPSEPQLFHEILRQVPVRYEEFAFIDLGSGKGRTLLMASDCPFRQIIGVEIIPELDAVARENIARYRNDAQRCFAISSSAGDACRFRFPELPILLYLFNPFPADVLRTVLQNLEQSLREHPRETWVVYHNLVYPEVFAEMRFLQARVSTHQYTIYQAKTDTL